MSKFSGINHTSVKLSKVQKLKIQKHKTQGGTFILLESLTTWNEKRF